MQVRPCADLLLQRSTDSYTINDAAQWETNENTARFFIYFPDCPTKDLRLLF